MGEMDTWRCKTLDHEPYTGYSIVEDFTVDGITYSLTHATGEVQSMISLKCSGHHATCGCTEAQQATFPGERITRPHWARET
jgi:hypothetical protein